MDKYQETFDTWDRLAELYEDKFMNLNLYNDSYDAFLEMLSKPKASVLDIGCGPGNISRYLLTKRPDLQILGIDASANMVKRAQKNNPLANFRVMDCRDINGLNEKFDSIICGFCIPYLSMGDCEKLISDCNLVLNESGIFYLSLVEGNDENSGYMSGNSGERIYFHFHTLSQLDKILEDNNFNFFYFLTNSYIIHQLFLSNFLLHNVIQHKNARKIPISSVYPCLLIR